MSPPRRAPERTPEEQLVELLGELGEPVEVLDRALARLGVPGAELRDERLEQVGLVPGRGRELAQVADVGAGGHEPRADGGGIGVGLGQGRLEQAVVGQLARLLRRDACPLAELLDADPGLLGRQAGRGGACAPWRPGEASSWRITRSGRNSSRWRRRIVSSRSTSSSLNSRYPPRVRFGESRPWSSR